MNPFQLRDQITLKTDKKGVSKNSIRSNFLIDGSKRSMSKSQGRFEEAVRRVKKKLENASDKRKGKPKALAKLSEIVEQHKSEVLSVKSKSEEKQPYSGGQSEPDKQVDQDLSPRNDFDNVQVVDPQIRSNKRHQKELKSNVLSPVEESKNQQPPNAQQPASYVEEEDLALIVKEQRAQKSVKVEENKDPSDLEPQRRLSQVKLVTETEEFKMMSVRQNNQR